MKKIMNKRFLCLLLGLVMLLSLSLTGCSEQTKEENASNIQEEASEDALTLSMYLMSELPVSAETAEDIEMEVNKLTKAKYTTQIELYFYTEAEYYQKLDAAFAAREQAKADGTLGNGAADSATIETTEDGKVSVEVQYPTIADYQVDIFYLGGVDRYQQYVAEGKLSNLNFELSDSGGSNSLKKYISPLFLDAMQGMGGKYAIPTNKTIGEYTYLLLNKEALNIAKRRVNGVEMNKTPYTSLTCEDTVDFLRFAKTYLGEQYAPLYTNLSEQELLLNNLKYWGVDEAGALADQFSVIGNYVDANASFLASGAYSESMQNLFENDQFVADLTTLNRYKVDGYYRAADDQKPFAVGYVKGGAELEDVYGDEYEMIVLEKPQLEADAVYSDMFGVSYCTADLARSMKILTYLNTSEDFRNLILYGVEGTHYETVELPVGDVTYKTAKRLLVGTENEYKMSIHKTGNELIAYPEYVEGATIVPNINEYGVKQNRDAKIDLYCGITSNYGGFAVNAAELQAVRAKSADLLNRYLNCNTAEAFAAYLTAAKSETAAMTELQNQLNADKTDSIAACYQSWKKAMKIKN